MTKADALQAYRQLQNLPPSGLSEPILNDVVDAAQALEPVAREVDEKMQKHRERLGVNGDPTDEEREKLEEVYQSIAEEECEIDPPRIDPTKMPTIGGMRELRELEALAPVLE